MRCHERVPGMAAILAVIAAIWMGLSGHAESAVPSAAPKIGRPAPLKIAPERAHGADLLAGKVGLTSTGYVTYIIANAGPSGTGQPFVVDVYINGTRKDTITHEAMAGSTQQTVTSSLARYEGCRAGTIKLVLDSQQVVTEVDESNNQPAAAVTPPCPDLVATITKDRMNNNLQYKAKVTVTNRGNLATPSFFIAQFSGGPPIGSLPFQIRKKLGPLAPG